MVCAALRQAIPSTVGDTRAVLPSVTAPIIRERYGLDGDAPQRPCGCIAQAWSVAEILRALVEDVYGLRPMLQPQVPAAQARAATAVRTAVSRQTGMRTGANP